MKPSRAIENLVAGRKDCGMIPEEEYTATIDLAAEALKLYKKMRKGSPPSAFPLLPGETEEGS